MAYSDYGGYAYKKGIRVEERSDAVLSEKGVQSTPGLWPGWSIAEGRNGGSYHVLLGDGPIYIGLYKQSTVSVHKFNENLSAIDFMECKDPNAIYVYTGKEDTEKYINDDYFREKGIPCVLNVEGCRIEIKWEEDDNYYLYVRLVQPDGTVWNGWSGYGVGAGLEDYEYGYSTGDREQRIRQLWPDDFKDRTSGTQNITTDYSTQSDPHNKPHCTCGG